MGRSSQLELVLAAHQLGQLPAKSIRHVSTNEDDIE